MQHQYINPDINVFAQTDFRNARKRFGIKIDDRRRHMYLVGKTGMGKSTMLENMVIADMWAGHGIGVIDPHGDFAEKIMDFIPPHRINDVIYFNPADTAHPLGFNILEDVGDDKRHLVASGLMGVFKKIWPDVWSARMEYILNNAILTLLECRHTTLLSINRLLADQRYRKKAVARISDPVVRAFWITEFDKYNDKYKQEAVAPIQNKIGQFLSASIVRNIVAQQHSTFNVRELMDDKKIFIINLAKGRIGEDASRLLGGMLITKLQLSAMERVDTEENLRRDFFLYVDEFQNFATESFANILSEARKYRLGLIMAHQYILQLDEKVAQAVFGNVGTLVAFRVGADDAEVLEKEFTPVFTAEDVVNLPKFHVYLKLMIDGVASQPFSAESLPPISERTGSAVAAIAGSRMKYATPVAEVEDRIRVWSEGEADGDFAQAQAPVQAQVPAPAVLSVPIPVAPPLPKQVEKKLPPPEKWFSAVCDRCGSATTVPFPPDGSRLIYCKDCYKLRHEFEQERAAPAPAQSVQPVQPVQSPAPKRKRKRHRSASASTSYDSIGSSTGNSAPPSA